MLITLPYEPKPKIKIRSAFSFMNPLVRILSHPRGIKPPEGQTSYPNLSVVRKPRKDLVRSKPPFLSPAKASISSATVAEPVEAPSGKSSGLHEKAKS